MPQNIELSFFLCLLYFVFNLIPNGDVRSSLNHTTPVKTHVNTEHKTVEPVKEQTEISLTVADKRLEERHAALSGAETEDMCQSGLQGETKAEISFC